MREAQTVAWEEQKRRERESSGHEDASALAGIARGLPEWQRAVKLQKRAATVGFDWPDITPVIAKLHEEIEEVRVEFTAIAADPADSAARDRLEEEIGDLLFVAANIARHARVDVGAAMRRANLKFERRFRAMEALADGDGTRACRVAPGRAGSLLEPCQGRARNLDSPPARGGPMEYQRPGLPPMRRFPASESSIRST